MSGDHSFVQLQKVRKQGTLKILTFIHVIDKSLISTFVTQFQWVVVAMIKPRVAINITSMSESSCFLTFCKYQSYSLLKFIILV